MAILKKSKAKTGKSKSKQSTTPKSKSKLNPKSAPKTPSKGSEPGAGPSKKSLKKNLLPGLLGATALVLLITLIIILCLPGPYKVCKTPECITLAHQLNNFGDKSVDPCQDFYKYSCGKFNEHSTQQGTIDKKGVIVDGLIREFLIKTKQSSSKSEQAMILLYNSCMDSHNETLKTQKEDENYKTIYAEIERMGYWPMMRDGKWNKGEYNINDLIAKTAHSTHQVFAISMGMFSFGIPYARKLFIVFEKDDIAQVVDRKEEFKNFSIANGLNFNEDSYNKDMQDVEKFKGKLLHIITTSQHPPPPEKLFLRYSEISNRIKEIDFACIIRKLVPKRVPENELNAKVFAENSWPFSDKTGSLDSLIQNTDEEVIANFLIYSYFGSAMIKLSQLAKAGDCASFVTRTLPQAALRVFVRNHFNKENIKSVSELVEDTKKSFIEMIEDSKWISEQTKKGAVTKVQKMEKDIGYPKEMEVSGALDSTFNIGINKYSDSFDIISRIEKRSIRQLMGYVLAGFPVNPTTLSLQTNAFYAATSNTLTVLVPIMDEPLFDHSFPQYAKIASIGFILAHEIGHGFDPMGIQFDENGMPRQWFSMNDVQSYMKKAQCFIKQYDTYDDPTFGKNMNGTHTLSENIADDLAADVSWRAFKNSNPSSEPKIFGFEDYDINKLFFQIVAMNWCSPRSTLMLSHQLMDTHATNSFRINGVLSNLPAFADTFQCPAGSPMNPEKKCDLI